MSYDQYINPDRALAHYTHVRWLIEQLPQSQGELQNKLYDILQKVSYSFIYYPDDFIIRGAATKHWEMIKRYNLSDLDTEYYSRETIMHEALIGRTTLDLGGLDSNVTELQENGSRKLIKHVTESPIIVAFWNKDDDLYRVMLDDCLAELDRYLPNERKILTSTPNAGITTPDKAIRDSGDTREPVVSPEELAKMRAAHLLRGRGRTRTPSRPHKMQQALRSSEIQGPGQKWQAPHSEQVQEIANMITEDPDIFI